MQLEIEAKFLDIDHDVIRAKLETLGATRTRPLQTMRRKLFDYPDGRLHKSEKGRLRVRDEGDKVTFTYKNGHDAEYSGEVETVVESFEATCQILEAIGLQTYTSQETRREVWQLGDVEIMLDEWPWLNPFIEIEGQSEAAIKAVAMQLGLEWADAKYGSADTAYRHQYKGMKQDETIGIIVNLTFDGELPQWLADRVG